MSAARVLLLLIACALSACTLILSGSLLFAGHTLGASLAFAIGHAIACMFLPADD